MADLRARPTIKSLLFRALRFLYLLWGGMLLMRLAAMGQIQFPAWIWDWPVIASTLVSPVGRGLLFGLGLAMALAALKEIWELVDMVLLRVLHDRERER